jgi:hypothetical protein
MDGGDHRNFVLVLHDHMIANVNHSTGI